MNPVEYDLDTSGGIMEQIQKLVAPPVSDDSARRSKRTRSRTAEHRRHGKTVNHDCCDSCKEGGDLLCCDRCPAAFHLLCHDPPLTDDDLPPGEWLCHRCKVTPAEGKDDDAESTSSGSSKRMRRATGGGVTTTEGGAAPEGEPGPGPGPGLGPGPGPSASGAGPSSLPAAVASSSSSERDVVVDDSAQEGGGGGDSGPFSLLIKAARLMNPVQFELSKDIACTTPLPGSSKHVYGRRYRPPKKQAHELDNGVVPLPAKLCFTCTKSCRIGPLIQCDYCPLLFHMDCLNPPLTSLPSGRWMCPNHVEHFLDEHMVRTNSLTERIKLWDKFTGVVDQDAVKLDFLKHVHRSSPPFRLSRPLPPRRTVQVPDAVKALYRTPPGKLPLAPRASSLSAPEAAVEAGKPSSAQASPEEQEEWLSSIASLQASIAKHLTQKRLRKDKAGAPAAATSDSKTPSETTSSSLSSSSSSNKPTASVTPVLHRDSDSSSTARGTSSSPMEVGTESGSGGSCNAGNSSSKPGQDSQNGGSSSSSEQSASFGAPKAVGAVSLLHGNVTTSGGGSLNGDAEILDVQKAKLEATTAAAAGRTRSNSTDTSSSSSSSSSTTAPSVIKVSWHGSDKSVTTPSSAGSSSGSGGLQGKNIVISTIHKGNNTVVTKLLPSSCSNSSGGVSATHTTSKVVLPPGVVAAAARTVCGGSPPTSILSPRVLVQPAGVGGLQRLVGSSSSSSLGNAGGQAGLGLGSSGGGTQTKVISVSTNTSGSKTATVVSGPKGSSLSSLPAIINLNTTLQQWMEGNAENVPDLDLGKIDQTLLQLLAWQRLQQLLPPSSSSSPGSASKRGLLNGLLTPGDSEVRARAVLCSLADKGQAVSMPYRTLSLGTGADMDVQLHQFGHCNFISSKHAVIFYDEMSRHFELLNYSDYGTTVDHVLYSCDFSDKAAAGAGQPTAMVAAVRDIVARGKKAKAERQEREGGEKEEEAAAAAAAAQYLMSARSREPQRACLCKAGGSTSLSLLEGGRAGWEGTAILHHGSYVQLGCLKFVFSIVDQAPPPHPPAHHLYPHGFSSSSSSSSSRTISRPPPEQMSLLKTHLKAAAQ